MKTLTILVAALAVALPTAAPAVAKKPKTKSLSLSGNVLGHNVAASAPDGSFVFAGTVDDAILGDSALVSTGENAGQGTISGDFTIYTTKGTLKGMLTLTVTPSQQSGFLDLNGTVKVTSGTGAYKGAKGSGTVTGTDETSTAYYKLAYKLPIKVKK